LNDIEALPENTSADAETAIISKVQDYEKILSEVIASDAAQHKAGRTASELWKKELRYLQGLRDPNEGKTIHFRRARLEYLRKEIEEMLAEFTKVAPKAKQ